MKQRILVTRPTFSDVVGRLREHFDVTLNEGPRYTPEQLNAALHGMDGALVSGGDKIDDVVLKGLSQLKAVCVTAAGYNNIDAAALTRAGVLGTNSPGPADEAVADFTWGLMIATARRLVEASWSIAQGEWKESFLSASLASIFATGRSASLGWVVSARPSRGERLASGCR